MLQRDLLSRTCLLLAAVALAGCHGPAPIQANVEFQTERGIVRGVSTESGIFALTEIVPPTSELSFRFRSGNGFFDDVATVKRKGDQLTLLAPATSKLNLARFGAYPAAATDALFLEVRTGPKADILRCHLFDAGLRGDLVVLDEGDFDDVVRRYTGSGLYAWRNGTMELVGILNGVYCEEPRALAFIGLDEMATLIPAGSDYYVRRSTPKRADFEYGVPRDFKGERTFASDEPEIVPAGEAPPAPPTVPPTTPSTPPNGDGH